jgi:hypothetical protein
LKHVIPADSFGPSPAAVGPAGASGKALRSTPSGTTPLVSISPRITSPSGTVVVVGAASCGVVVAEVVGVTITGSVGVTGPDVIDALVVVGMTITGGAVGGKAVGVVVVVLVLVGVTITG